jgi:cell wall-associated NlpC family hydrolase
MQPMGAHYAQGETRPQRVGRDPRMGQFVDAIEADMNNDHPYSPTQPGARLDCAAIVGQAAQDALNINIGSDIRSLWLNQSLTDVQSLGGAQYGDLVFTGWTGSLPKHVGVYLGSGQTLDIDRGSPSRTHNNANIVGIKRLPQ